MAAIKSRNNKSTELKLGAILKANRISGWRRQYKKISGTPDFVFPREKIALFIDGCFWHGCYQDCVLPKTNRKFWINKIRDNKFRDIRINRLLRSKGWNVLRIWEHELKKTRPQKIIKFLRNKIH